MSTEKKIAELRAEYLKQRAECFDEMVNEPNVKKTLESPIEQLSFAAMLVNEWEAVNERAWRSTRAKFFDLGMTVEGFLRNPTLGVAGFQASFNLGGKPVRFDAVVIVETYGADTVLVIEFDGHDFHERTKEQARRDKSRDRAITLLGWTPLRFTGSEIYADPGVLHDHISELYFKSVDEGYQAYLREKAK